MSGRSSVDQEQCDQRMEVVYSKIDEMNKTLGKVHTNVSILIERRKDRKWMIGTMIASGMFILALMGILMSGGGCRASRLDNLKGVRSLADYAELKRDISSRVRKLGINHTQPVTTSRSYEVESDGTMWLIYYDRRVATNRWTKSDWSVFRADCRAGLWDRLQEAADRFQFYR